MSWWRPAGSAHAAANHGLGDHVWAARARLGPVPPGWVGLLVSQSGLCEAWVEAGTALPTKGKLAGVAAQWWVRAAAWQFNFVPWPEQAPEAGLAVTLELDCAANVDNRTLLASALAAYSGDITAKEWAAEWRVLKQVQAIPTCVQPSGLLEITQALEQFVWPKWQVRLKNMRRVDLSVLEEAPGEWPQEAPPAPETSPASKEAEPAQATSPTSPAPASPQALPNEAEMLRQDAQLWSRIARGLPGLGLELERRWAGGGWSSEPSTASRQRGVAQRIGLMASKIGALPALRLNFASPSSPAGSEVTACWAHGIQAVEALVRVQSMVEGLARATTPTSQNLDELEQALGLLDDHIHFRLHPWWE